MQVKVPTTHIQIDVPKNLLKNVNIFKFLEYAENQYFTVFYAKNIKNISV